VSNLINEILLRFSKLVFAAVLGALVYLVAVGPLSVQPSFELAALCWICVCVALLLVESSPI
jgi:hypothetical protein